MTDVVRSIPQIVRTAQPTLGRGRANVSQASFNGISPANSSPEPCSGAQGSVSSGHSSQIQQQRFAIITVYSLAILLAMGYVPGFGL